MRSRRHEKGPKEPREGGLVNQMGPMIKPRRPQVLPRGAKRGTQAGLRGPTSWNEGARRGPNVPQEEIRQTCRRRRTRRRNIASTLMQPVFSVVSLSCSTRAGWCVKARAASTRPTTKAPQIGKCASVRPPPAARGAFVDLGRHGGGSGGRSSSPGVCMNPVGCLAGMRWDCGRDSAQCFIENIPKQRLPKTKENQSPTLWGKMENPTGSHEGGRPEDPRWGPPWAQEIPQGIPRGTT